MLYQSFKWGGPALEKKKKNYIQMFPAMYSLTNLKKKRALEIFQMPHIQYFVFV